MEPWKTLISPSRRTPRRRNVVTLDPLARTFRYEFGGDTSNIGETFSFEASDGERTNTISASLSDSIILSDHKKETSQTTPTGFRRPSHERDPGL